MSLVGEEMTSEEISLIVSLGLLQVTQTDDIFHHLRCMAVLLHLNEGIVPGLLTKDPLNPTLDPVVGHSFKTDHQGLIFLILRDCPTPLIKELGLLHPMHRCRDPNSRTFILTKEIDPLLLLSNSQCNVCQHLSSTSKKLKDLIQDPHHLNSNVP